VYFSLFHHLTLDYWVLNFLIFYALFLWGYLGSRVSQVIPGHGLVKLTRGDLSFFVFVFASILFFSVNNFFYQLIFAFATNIFFYQQFLKIKIYKIRKIAKIRYLYLHLFYFLLEKLAFYFNI